MTRLLKKSTDQLQGPNQAQAFQTLKTAFTTVPVLVYYNYIKKTVVEINTLNWALGGVLY